LSVCAYFSARIRHSGSTNHILILGGVIEVIFAVVTTISILVFKTSAHMIYLVIYLYYVASAEQFIKLPI
jgi:hypothetical protein